MPMLRRGNPPAGTSDCQVGTDEMVDENVELFLRADDQASLDLYASRRFESPAIPDLRASVWERPYN
jgi:hypothetical protein